MKIIRLVNEGQYIYGTLHLPAGKKKFPAVIYSHGHTANRHEAHFFSSHMARELAKVGIACLVFDFRGSGESEMDFSDMTITSEMSDLKAVFAWLSKRKEIDAKRIGVIGMSLGGYVTASVLEDLKCKVKTAVLLNAPALLKPIWGVRLKDKGLNDFPMEGIDFRGFFKRHRFYDDMLLHEHQPIGGVFAYEKPLLLISAGKDETVKSWQTNLFYEFSASKIKKLHVIKGSDHCLTNVKYENEFIGVVKKWFIKYL